MIRIHDSLTGQKQELRPIRPGEVRMYLCGDTVYDFCHIGHARSKVAFDVVRRYLTHRGYRVVFVRNITDIDDKIIRRAAELGEPIEVFTERYIAAMHEDYDRLGILRPDYEPRATQYVPGMVALAQRLIDRGHAYVADDGDVMYSVSSFAPYGQLSGKKLADLRAGARIEVDAAKRDPLDFVLWKRAKPGEPSWESPWGPGRPGWHIECSVMSADILGDEFDIHAGGMDLKFPHHENEIAQSCAATGAHFAHLWMHNGFVNVDDEKMSKSLGNFFTIADVLQRYDGEAIRLFMLRTHYRSPFNFSDRLLEESRTALRRLYGALEAAGDVQAAGRIDWADPRAAAFKAGMDDDFNTPVALAVLFDLAAEVNRGQLAAAALLKALGGVLGILQRAPRDVLQGVGAAGGMDETEIEERIAARAAAKKARDFALADRIRDELAAAGVVLKDSAQGTTWVRA